MSTQVISIGDFVTESFDFTRSTAYYELMTECLQLQMISLDYMKESGVFLSEDLLDSPVELSENVKEKLTTLRKSLTSKIQSIWRTILAALKTFFKNVANIFTNSQNREIAKLEETAQELFDKIEQMETDNAEAQELLIQEMKSITDNYEDELLGLEEKLGGANRTIDQLHKRVTAFNRNNSKTASELNKVLTAVSKLVNDGADLEVSDITADANKYITNFIDFFSNPLKLEHDQLAIKFCDRINDGGPGRVNAIMKEISDEISNIKHARATKSKKRISGKRIKEIYDKIEQDLPSIHNSVQSSDSERTTGLDEKCQKILQDHSELFSKYTTLVSEYSVEFKAASAQIISETKDFFEARKGAIDIEIKLQSAISNFIRNAKKAEPKE